jgi:integrase
VARNRIVLSDRFCASPSRVPPAGKRNEYYDALAPGLCLRVSETGHRSFNMVARFPANPVHPTRRLIGEYGTISLEDAREVVREWHALIRRGIDPKAEILKQRAEARRKHAMTFEYVMDEYLTRAAPERSGMEVRRLLTKEFLPLWGNRSITDIRREEIAAAIREIVRSGRPGQAHNSFSILRRMFNWAIGSSEYGLDHSPMAALKPADVIGQQRGIRDRVLTDAELRAIWQGADALGYPHGAIVKMLVLTGQRLNEIASLQWSEIDLAQKVITISADRMKGGIAHEVPLAPMAYAMLSDPSFPRWKRGPFVFSATGERPVQGFSKLKAKIDQASGVSDWVLHDIRRSARKRWSALPVEDRVRELAMAHQQPGLHKVYDLHRYRAEKESLFRQWETMLTGIIQPMPPADVIPLRRKLEARPAAAPIVPLRPKVEPRPTAKPPLRRKVTAR